MISQDGRRSAPMGATERAGLEALAEYALPEDAPGAWIRAAVREMLEGEA